MFFIVGEFFNIFINYSLEKDGEKHKKVLKLNMLKSFENIELKEFESVDFKNKTAESVSKATTFISSRPASMTAVGPATPATPSTH